MSVTSLLRRVGRAVLRGLRAVVPVVGDTRREWVRKLSFWLALVVFICSGYYLADEMWLGPRRVDQVTHSLRDLYTRGDGKSDGKEETPDTTVYPTDMDPAFAPLYRLNSDVRGWLSFSTTGEDLFNGAVDNPVVQTTDNDQYLNKTFLGEKNKAGTLFFDYRNDLNPGSSDRNWIIYGHNLNSGLMFSRLNLLVTGRVERAKRLTTLTLDTFYGEKLTYKVFAVMVIDAQAAEFGYTRTRFTNDDAFTSFVEEVRARSLYDFGDVDVKAGDRLLTLSTCTNKRDTHLNDGRAVVVARCLREGESAEVNTDLTVLNEDVLMPRAWYVNQKKELPAAYQ